MGIGLGVVLAIEGRVVSIAGSFKSCRASIKVNELCYYQKLQVDVYLCTLKSQLENVSPYSIWVKCWVKC